MSAPSHRFPGRFMFVPGIFIGMTIGQVALAESDELTGPQVYDAVCVACHAAPGVGGAPAFGDSDAWAARIDQGMDTLIDHALHGYSSSTGIMPKKGGRVDLSDAEVIAAVEYMVEQASPRKLLH